MIPHILFLPDESDSIFGVLIELIGSLNKVHQVIDVVEAVLVL